jgi:hypothetical protein
MKKGEKMKTEFASGAEAMVYFFHLGFTKEVQSAVNDERLFLNLETMQLVQIRHTGFLSWEAFVI